MQRPAIPLEIVIEMTGQCRQSCSYCTGQRSGHAPWHDLQKTIDEISRLGIRTVRLTGGEPLLHPDLRKILFYAKSKKLSVILNTAAQELSTGLLNDMAVKVDAALVSLQGYNQRSNAAYTHCRSSFVDKVKNIFLLKSFVPNLWIATVITPQVGRSFAKFLPLIKKIAPARWALFRAVSEKASAQQMDTAFFRALTLDIMKARQQKIDVSIGNGIPMCITGNLEIGQKAFFGGSFDDGHLRLVRDARGFFKPSYFLDINLGDTIEKAWSHPVLDELNRTDFLPYECQTCPMIRTCRGGCRAMSLRVHGDILTHDPLFDPTMAQRALAKICPEIRPR